MAPGPWIAQEAPVVFAPTRNSPCDQSGPEEAVLQEHQDASCGVLSFYITFASPHDSLSDFFSSSGLLVSGNYFYGHWFGSLRGGDVRSTVFVCLRGLGALLVRNLYL